MKLRVNGEDGEYREGLRLTELLAQMGIDRRFLVVEHNGEPLAPDYFEETTLREGDRLELVRPVAGG